VQCLRCPRRLLMMVLLACGCVCVITSPCKGAVLHVTLQAAKSARGGQRRAAANRNTRWPFLGEQSCFLFGRGLRLRGFDTKICLQANYAQLKGAVLGQIRCVCGFFLFKTTTNADPNGCSLLACAPGGLLAFPTSRLHSGGGRARVVRETATRRTASAQVPSPLPPPDKQSAKTHRGSRKRTGPRPPTAARRKGAGCFIRMHLLAL
jgi:hypothetical protein